MTDSTLAALKKLLVTRYASLRTRIEFIAGSKESATEILNETWMRLDSMTEVGPVANPDGFLIRMASNLAIDRHRREKRHLHDEEVDEMFEVQDELADPERIVASRLQLEALEEVLRGLTPRRRAILWAARVDGQVNREIALRFKISLRLVEKELSLALKYCNECMWERSYNDGTGRKPKP
jgi:RNA polymerase sigma factor (sigma-70 family)